MSTSTIFSLTMTGLSVCALAWMVWHTKRQMARWKAEQAWRERPDPVAVAAQRQLYQDGEFRRAITGWSAYNMDCDRGDLACGHWILRSVGNHEEIVVDCSDCARDFLAKARLTMRK